MDEVATLFADPLVFAAIVPPAKRERSSDRCWRDHQLLDAARTSDGV